MEVSSSCNNPLLATFSTVFPYRASITYSTIMATDGMHAQSTLGLEALHLNDTPAQIYIPPQKRRFATIQEGDMHASPTTSPSSVKLPLPSSMEDLTIDTASMLLQDGNPEKKKRRRMKGQELTDFHVARIARRNAANSASSASQTVPIASTVGKPPCASRPRVKLPDLSSLQDLPRS